MIGNLGARRAPLLARSIVRTSVIGIGLVALTVGAAAHAAGQGLIFDARRIGMGGLTLGRSASLVRYNPAYRAVPEAADRRGRPRVTIPIPLGIIQFLHDHPHLSTDPAFHRDSAGFNPILVANTLLNLPIFLEVKKAPTPTNDVLFRIGKNELRVNLGAAAQLVPEDQFGFGGSSRVLDPGLTIKGVRVSVLGWLHYDLGMQLGDTLLAFLRDSVPAKDSTGYSVLGSGIAEGGFADDQLFWSDRRGLEHRTIPRRRAALLPRRRIPPQRRHGGIQDRQRHLWGEQPRDAVRQRPDQLLEARQRVRPWGGG